MRSVTELSKLNGKVYVYLKNEIVAGRFLRDAEKEGFTFGDGAKPTARPGNNLYVVNKDWTIGHVGWAGHMAFQSAKTIGEVKLIRVDYEKYLLDENCYTMDNRMCYKNNRILLTGCLAGGNISSIYTRE